MNSTLRKSINAGKPLVRIGDRVYCRDRTGRCWHWRDADKELYIHLAQHAVRTDRPIAIVAPSIHRTSEITVLTAVLRIYRCINLEGISG